MTDITYCAVNDCPFVDCFRHISRVPRQSVISMAMFDTTCQKYIAWTQESVDICGATELPCIKCNPGGCDHRKEHHGNMD